MKKITLLIFIFLLTLGILFRFVNIEQKPYWGDEADSLSWISGIGDFKKIALQGREMSVSEVLSYQNPYPGTNLSDTYKNIYYEHAPLYYLLARLWIGIDSSHLFTARSLAVVIGLLVFPCLYWLCLELFQSSLVGWTAMAIAAVSPFHLLYAQEARQYTLWMVFILLTSLTLLRAIRLNTIWSWLSYIIALTLMLYTHLLSVVVILIYSLYVLLQESFRFSKTLIVYAFSSLVSFLLFTPWLIVIASHLQLHQDQSPSWSKEPTPLVVLLKTWILNFNLFFWDFNQNFIYQNLPLYLLIISFIGYSIYFLRFNSQKRTWLFLGLMIIVPFALLATPDIILGGRRSTPSRYFIPACLSIEMIVAYLISIQLISIENIKNWQRKCLAITTVILIILGVLSCGLIVQENTWWSKQREYYHNAVAKVVNATKKPLVVAPWFDMRTLAHSFASHVTLQEIRLLKDVSSLGDNFTEIFVYNDEQVLNQLLKNQPNLKVKDTYKWFRQTTPVNSTKTSIWKLIRR